MTLEQKNDQHRLKRAIEILDVVGKMEFQTETGKDFHDTLLTSINDIIKPSAREAYKQIENGN